ncbi:major facilitator superfamily domain-containing protein 6-like [Nematostella vectensis]|nr:major facilitator superfamily domain-containing protein 6-like [Nematostella vectensis]
MPNITKKNISMASSSDNYRRRNLEGENNESQWNLSNKLNLALLPSKIFYFFYFSAWGSLLPYLALYFKKLGLLPSQVGVLMGLRPFVNFICVPLFGLFVDKFNKGKHVIVVALAGSILTVFSISIVAPAKENCHEVFNITRRALRNDSVIFVPLEENFNSTSVRVFHVYRTVTAARPWPLGVILSLKECTKSRTSVVFVRVLLLLIFGNIIASPSLSLADTVTMHNLGGDKHRYGVQRLWGSLGFGVAAFGIGALVSARGYCMGDSGDSQTVDVDYTPCFYSFAAFLSCALITSFKFNFPNDTCPKGKTSDRLYTVRSLLRGRFLMFLLVAFHFGFMIAFTKTFLFWHLKELGGTQLLFCIITAVNCIAEVTMYFLSAKLLTFITHTRVLYMGFLCYAIRAFAYYLITSPWMVLTVEILSGITSAASWAAMLAFVSENSTPGYTATFQGVIHAIHWGLGCGAGEMVGGYMVDALGTGGSFCVLGVLSLGLLVLDIVTNNMERVMNILQGRCKEHASGAY